MKTILEAENLNTFYGHSHILFDVSLSVASGETVCLMGRNGAGKTTTFRSIMNLTPPRTGHIHFQGKDCTRLSPHQMSKIGLAFVPEDRRIFGPFTVKENLELGKLSGRTGQWDMDSVLQYFPTLQDMLNRAGGSLSGGEQQMLTIARALMSNPEVLILDEPTEGLSPVIIRDLKKLLLDLKALGITILLSEQNTVFAMGVSDRVVIIDMGHVVYQGTVEELKSEKEIYHKYLAF